MAALTGNTIASTYKQLLKLTSEGVGADASAKYIEDGLGTDTALSLSTTRVGIGTTSPSENLHVYSTAAEAVTAKISTNQDQEASLKLQNSVDEWEIKVDNSTGTFNVADVGGAVRTTWLNSGNIGIGTVTPENMLEVSSDTSAITRGIGISNYEDGVSSGALLTLRHARGTEDLPTASQSGDDLGNIYWRGYDNAGWEPGAYLKCETTETWDATGHGTKFTFHLNTDNSTGPGEKMCILGSGNVGIGTTSPDNLLEVSASGSGAIMSITSYDDDSTDCSTLQIQTADGTEGFPALIDDNEIVGQIKFRGYTDAWKEGAIIRARASGTPAAGNDMPTDLEFCTAADGAVVTGDPQMIIQADGKVGIGVSSPSESLDVNGTVRAKALRLDEAANVNEGTITNTSVAGYSRLKASTNSGGGSTGVLIKGLDGGVEGQVLYIYKTSSNGILRIYNNSTNASAGDKILVPGCVADDDSDYITIPAGGYGGFTLVYDTSAAEAYWHLIASAPNADVTA